MKVQLTIELDDTQRTAVGLAETGLMTPANRVEIKSYALGVVMGSINAIAEIVREHETDTQRRETLVLGRINAQLDGASEPEVSGNVPS